MKKLIHLVTAFSFAFQPVLASADGSVVTSALQGLSGGLGILNSGFTAVQNAQTQMQSMVNQFAALQTQTAAGNAAQSKFNQVATSLQQAMTSAQSCIAKYSKAHDEYKKAPTDQQELLAKIDEAPTCTNYGAILDSLGKIKAQMRDANSKMACLNKLQTDVNTIADNSKSIFNDLTKAANDVWNTNQQIIDSYQSIVDQIDKDVDAEGGYADQLSQLEQLTNKIGNALNSGTQSGKDGTATTGISQRITDLKRQRVSLANKWYYNLMSEVQSCFASDSSKQCSFGTAASPMACIAAYVGNTGKGTASERAQAKANSSRLQSTFMFNSSEMRTIGQQVDVDVSQPDQFLKVVDQRYGQMVSKVVANFNSQQFIGNNVDKGAINEFVRAKYQECYSSAVDRFKADMNSEGGAYKSLAESVTDAEASLNQDIVNLVDEAQNAITGFNTSFNKVYSQNVSQFASDCTASGSPYASADCLRKLYVTMKGGIEGTNQSVKMENGTTTTYTPAPTRLNLQTMVLDQTGKPTLSTTAAYCTGFKGCLNTLENYKAQSSGALKKQENDRKAFVENSNKTMDAAMTAVSGQFAQVSQAIQAGVQGVNDDLGKAGILGAQMTTKQVDGEALAKDDKTGLYQTPSSMKAAFAGVGSYVEIGDTQGVTDAYNSRMSALEDKGTEAGKMKGQCSIKQSDIDSIKNRIGHCDENICNSNRVARVMSPLEALLRKSQVMPDDGSKNQITDDFKSCSKGARNTARNNESDDLSNEAAIEGITDTTKREALRNKYNQQKANRQKYSNEDAQSCSQDSVGDLEALASSSRSSMKTTNDKIMAAIRTLSDACSANPVDVEAAQAACEDARSAVGDAKPPTDEDETKITSGGSSAEFTNPLDSQPKSSGAQ